MPITSWSRVKSTRNEVKWKSTNYHEVSVSKTYPDGEWLVHFFNARNMGVHQRKFASKDVAMGYAVKIMREHTK